LTGGPPPDIVTIIFSIIPLESPQNKEVDSVWIKLSLIALAGAAGTLCRYGLGGFVQGMQEGKLPSFPWGTVAVNLLGCLVFGLIFSALERRMMLGGEVKIVLLLGFMGGFTTFSSYMFELAEQLRDNQWFAAAYYFALHNLGGWATMILGLFLGKWI
jgi:fluoride exporter